MTECRICYEPGHLISVCCCDGTCAVVHFDCIQKWILISKRKRCEICNHLYTYPGLRFVRTVQEERSRRVCILSCVFGFMYGFAMWFDSNVDITRLWLFIFSAFLCNFSLAALALYLYEFKMRFWRAVLYFYLAFVAGNMPGHLITGKINGYVGLCYALNVLFMCGFLSVEKHLFSQLGQPAH